MLRSRIATALAFAAALAAPVSAQQPVAPADTTAPLAAPAGVPVIVRGDTLFRLYDRIGPFSPAERARAVEERLLDLIRNPALRTTEILAVAEPGAYDISAGDRTLLTVTAADAAGAGAPLAAAARDYSTAIRAVLSREIEASSPARIALAALYTLLATFLLVLVLRVVGRVSRALRRWIRTRLPVHLPSLRYQDFEVARGERIAYVLDALVRLARLVVTVVLLYLYLPLVLSFFPWTRRLSGEIVGWVVDPVRSTLAGMLAYLPSLFTVLVILGVTYYAIKLVKQFFLALENGSIQFEGFYPEWAMPTYKLVRLLIVALALVMVWPYLPNSDSDAFKGVAAFLGLLITFGSAGMISNVVGGLMLTYMRAFRVADRVKIADTMGDVIEQNLLVTRVRTIKNVDVTIPNSLVLGAHIINFSRMAPEGGVILHTGVTIGYDVPWRQVHGLLVDAARATEGILSRPAPFVLQTSLDDFYVAYELNAYTSEPTQMATIYSRLHENIQDRFNTAGVEIMSPHYGALRDGNRTAIPDDYLPKNYEAGGFRFRRR